MMLVDPLKGKVTEELIRGTERIIANIGKPKKIYSDMEGGMTSKRGTQGWMNITSYTL